MKNNMFKKNETITFRIHTQLKQHLQQQAKQQHLSLSNYIEGLLQTDLEHPCQKSQRFVCLIEIYNAIERGEISHALELLEKEIDKNETAEES